MEIGKNSNRIDAYAKVTGKALYPGDFNYPNQTYAKVLFSAKPHAVIKNLDISDAEKLSGVLLILTAKDVPNNEYGLGIADQPVFCGPGSGKPYADRVRCVSDQIAMIIAESEEIANHARSLIKVEYEDLPLVDRLETALNPDTVIIHPNQGSNILAHNKIRRGEFDNWEKYAEVIVEDTYETPVQEHAYLQPEAGIGYIDEDDRVTVIVGGQWTHEDQEQIAHSLNLPLDQVRVIYPAIGGAFGGREDMSVQIILGLAALKLKEKGINRPVKIIWSREESIIGHHKRHRYVIHSKWGATRDGKLVGATVDVKSDAGAYAYTSPKVLGNATLMCTGPYEIPNVKVDAYTIYTNNIPGGAFRGFGGPQAAFSAETQMNKLAKLLNMDPVELRMKNILKEGSILSVGSPLPAGVSLPEVVTICAEKSGWTKSEDQWKQPQINNHGEIKSGIGFACGYKNIGFSYGAKEQCTATIEIYGDAEIREVILKHSGAEVGQGSHSAFRQMAADAVGVPLDKVKLIASDTAVTDNSGSVSASRMTFMAGNSIYGAGKLAIEKWQNEERPAIAKYQYFAPATSPYDPETGECIPNISYGYVAESVEVEVDTETGEITVKNIVCADDVGKAINPVLVEGQIEGCIVQAAGYTLMENFVQENGYCKTSTLSTYLIPTSMDIPENVESVILEYPDPRGPWGARGVGEMPFIPLSPAIIAAVHNATGVWFDKFPLTPEVVLRGLGKLDQI